MLCGVLCKKDINMFWNLELAPAASNKNHTETKDYVQASFKISTS